MYRFSYGQQQSWHITHASLSRPSHQVPVYGESATSRHLLPNREAKLLICTGTGTLPLRWQEWDSCLSLYPDQRSRAYIVDGICHGFCVGYNQEATCRSSRGNMKSALENPHVNGEYLHAECEVGRVIGSLDPSSHLHVHTSRFGVVPKSVPGNGDMSFLEGGSVYDWMKEPCCLLSYATVIDAVCGITAYGREYS